MPQKTASQFAIFVLVIVIAVASLVLLLRNTRTPPEPETPRVTSTLPAAQPIAKSEEQKDCEVVGGMWKECGSPCVERPGEACIQVCQKQCLCGAKNAWRCPNDLACVPITKEGHSPSVDGVCRPRETKSSDDQTVRLRPVGSLCDSQNFICVNDSYQNSFLASPFFVTGTGLAFEQTIFWNVKDGAGTVLAKGTVTTQSADVDQPGLFALRAFLLYPSKATTGTLEFYEVSAKDGKPVHDLRIPVHWSDETQTMKVFLFQASATSGQDEVMPVFVVIPLSRQPIEATMNRLLDESRTKTTLIKSLIPRSTRLTSLNLKSGVLTLVFSPSPWSDAGESTRKLIQEQIEKTAKQFTSVKEVKIISE